ncbi:MAG TPA: transcriptional repressor, partial [Pyrinomonadaceae bacterium]
MAAKQKINEREVLRQALHEQGVQLTSQRVAVYEYLSGVEHHPTAEEIYLAVKPRLPRISLA